MSVSILGGLIKDNILASETIAIVLPTIALIPCTIYTAIIRSKTNLTYTPCVRNGLSAYLVENKIGSVDVYEPFSTTTNLGYIMSGIGIYLYYIPNRAFVHSQMYMVGLLFIILGTGSVTMHAGGSRVGGWEHATDIFSIYAFFVGLSGVSMLGLYQAVRQKPLLPTSTDIVPPIMNTLILLGIGFSIFFWNRIDQAKLLVSTSVIIIVSNASTQGLFAMRSVRNIERNKVGCFVSAFTVSIVPRAIVLLTAIYINLNGRILAGDLQRSCRGATDIEYRIEVLKRWDWMHGLWHYLSAIALTGMALSSQQGLDGITEERLGIENTQMPFVRWLIPFAIKTDEYVEELVSRFVISCFCLSCIMMFESDVSAGTWQRFLLGTSLSILPMWSYYGCYSIYKSRHAVQLL